MCIDVHETEVPAYIIAYLSLFFDPCECAVKDVVSGSDPCSITLFVVLVKRVYL